MPDVRRFGMWRGMWEGLGMSDAAPAMRLLAREGDEYGAP
ncbi:MAG: hypothetical protein OJF49_002726 [Ktedonobacterales bacterium]|nr:MAG: hypothetical protein OJF49_002726 [Ktedonobacterales bacterium]